MKNPLVVGYKGEIGSFILQGLLREMPKASNILCYDINDNEKERIKRIKKADVIFLCIPIQDTVEWFRKYQKQLSYTNKIVVEQTSLKSVLFNSKKFATCYYTVLSMHILFRPSATPNKVDRVVALVGKNAWFKHGGLASDISIITSSNLIDFKDWKEHDKAMAKQQALVHRVILTLNKCIETGADTYIGKRVKELAARIQKIDPILYEIIQKNVYTNYEVANFEREMKNWRQYVKNNRER